MIAVRGTALHAVRERRALQACDHTFVSAYVAAFQDQAQLFLLCEAARGYELFFLLRETPRFDPSAAALFAAMALAGLSHLHERGLVYRDLKPENLVLDAEGYLKLVDLGLARPLAPGERAWTLCGTAEYVAPEVVCGSGHSAPADFWALGVLLYEMLAGYPPFCADSALGVFALALHSEPTLPDHFPPEAKALVGALLVRQPRMRLGSLGARGGRCGGAVDVACHAFFEGIDWRALLAREVEAPVIPDAPAGGSVDLASIETVLAMPQQQELVEPPEQEPPPRERAASSREEPGDDVSRRGGAAAAGHRFLEFTVVEEVTQTL
eukprot:Transcript_20447.p2 GENE.Transcript_20447~~Transcript_20447.p2  ORF type:complete len:324 (+),score=162.70 Transcript_20447:963-1934(+)